MNNEMKPTASTVDRRSVLKKAAAAGLIVWSTPTLLEHTAHATQLGGTPKCRPTLSVECVAYDCLQGGKVFPGFRVTRSSTCPCDSTVAVRLCAKVANLPSDIIAYGPPTECGPRQGGGPADNILSTGTFRCIPASGNTIFLGRARAGNGAIPELGASGTNNTVQFQLCLYAGPCPSRSGGVSAYVCQSYLITFEWANGSNTFINCRIVANNDTCGCESATAPCSTC